MLTPGPQELEQRMRDMGIPERHARRAADLATRAVGINELHRIEEQAAEIQERYTAAVSPHGHGHPVAINNCMPCEIRSLAEMVRTLAWALGASRSG